MNRASVKAVCVIGGGPAGLAAAIALAQTGCRVVVADHAVPPVDKACGEGAMPDSIPVLAQLGVTVPFDAGFRFRGIRFSDAHSSVAADFGSGPAVGLRRVVLHDLLRQRAEELGIECIWGAQRIDFGGKRVDVDGRAINADFIVGADGQNSRTRRAFGLQATVRERRRFGFRRHYRIAPWSPYMELVWGPGCQIYITPVSNDEVCVVSMSDNPKHRLDDALSYFPELRERLATAKPSSRDRGAPSVSRKLRQVCSDDVALVGDASGSVDAITGEGLCLSFKQALALAKAVQSNSLYEYQPEHELISRRPYIMARLMLMLDSRLQRRALRSLSLHPKLFESLLAVHIGDRQFSQLFSWNLVRFCRAFLEA